MSISRSNIDALSDIRNMMERSSRFISLSGWSGISAGMFALAGVWVAHGSIERHIASTGNAALCTSCLEKELITIALIILALASTSAILFTVAKSKKDGMPIWGPAVKKLLWNTLLPMLVGGIVIWRLLDLEYYELVVPLSLLFYGLALINGSKFTMGAIRYLGYGQILTGIVSMYILSHGLYAWAFGFGVLHIIYGIAMWWMYDRKNTTA